MNATDATGALFGSLTSLLLFAGLYVWTALALSAVFRKSGVERWQAWVPVLNLVVLLRLAGLSPWLLLLALIPFLGWIPLLVVFALAVYRLSVAFGFGAGMTVLAILAFPVWASVVGWGSARWVGWEQSGSGVRRSSDAGLPPLPPFASTTPNADTGAFPPAPPAPGAASAFAPPPAPVATPSPAAASSPAADWPSAGASPSVERVATRSAADASPVARSGTGRAEDGPARRADVAPPAAGWAPPPLPGRPVATTPAPAGRADDADPWQGFALDSTDHGDEVTGAFPGAPAPISAVPAVPAAEAPAAPAPATPAGPALPPAEPDADAAAPAPLAAPTAPLPAASVPAAPVPAAREESAAPVTDEADDVSAQPPVTRVPAAAPGRNGYGGWAPTRSAVDDADAFPEASGPVSAVYGAPDAGAPRAARSSVSAFHGKPEIPDEDDIDALDQTIIARRKRSDWTLVPPAGDPVALSADVVILGRRPARDPEFPQAQLVAIQDGTVSKTHARLRLRDDRWYVTDLDSTNGVLFATVMGTEVEVPRGEEVEAGDRFLLGDAEVRLQRSDG